MSNTLWPNVLQPTRLLSPWDSPGKNTGVACHSLLQGIFLTQGSNLFLVHCRQILYLMSHQGSPSGGNNSQQTSQETVTLIAQATRSFVTKAILNLLFSFYYFTFHIEHQTLKPVFMRICLVLLGIHDFAQVAPSSEILWLYPFHHPFSSIPQNNFKLS